MFLSDLVRMLCDEQPLAPITMQQYQRAAKRFAVFLGRPPEIRDLTADTVNQWLVWLQDTYQLGPTSIANYRTAIVRLWNYAAEPLQLCGQCPSRRVRRPKQQEHIVSAWSLDTLLLLLRAAESLPGRLRAGIRASDFMRAWLWVGYETGLRPGDMRSLLWTNIDWANRSITLIQSKTGRLHVTALGEASIAALNSLPQCRAAIFPCGKSGIYRWANRLYTLATSHGFHREPRQGLGTLRKTHATEIYRQFGLAAAAESLGHASSRVVQRHYIDAKVRRTYLPPTPTREETP